MEKQEIYASILAIASLFNELNERWQNDPCSADIFQVFRQEEYQEVYEKLKAADMERIALSILDKSVNERVLTRLRKLLAKSVRIYQARQTDFDGMDFRAIYLAQEEYLFEEKLRSLRNDLNDTPEFPYPAEQGQEIFLKETRQEIIRLENEKMEYKRTGAWIGKNYYLPINELSRSFISILDAYFPVETKNQEGAIDPHIKIKEGVYFDMSLIAPIHKVCNNIQFENLSEIDFYAQLNLQPTNARLIVKAGERTRVCYLIYKLYEHLKTDSKTEWRTIMLRTLEIKEDFYKSKYKDAVSELPSRKSGNFAQQIDEIFEKIF